MSWELSPVAAFAIGIVIGQVVLIAGAWTVAARHGRAVVDRLTERTRNR